MNTAIGFAVIPFSNLISPSEYVIFNRGICVAYLILKAGNNIIGIGRPGVFVYTAKG